MIPTTTTTTTTTTGFGTFAKLTTTVALALSLFAGVAGSATAASINPDRLTSFDGGGGLGNARIGEELVGAERQAPAGTWHGGFYVGFLPE